jgi:aryl-alcohol dehydrogenase-like predicted oxidoreductase
LARNLALAEALGPIASRHGVTVAAVAVAWTLAFSGVTGAIVGIRRAGQLDAWLPAACLALDDSDLSQIAEAVERTRAGSGPTFPAHAV